MCDDAKKVTGRFFLIVRIKKAPLFLLMDQEPAADIFLYSQDNESLPRFSYTSKSEISAVELARLLGFVALRVRGSIRLLIHEKCPPGHFILIPLAGGQLLLNAGTNITATSASHNRAFVITVFNF